MNKGFLKDILIVLLLTIAVFSIFKYKTVLNEKYELLNTLFQAKARIGSLEKERQSLLQDIEKNRQKQEELQANLQATSIRLSKLFADYNEKENALNELTRQFSLLRIENISLKEQKYQILQENESLKERLTSIEELKKIIQDLSENRIQAENAQEGNKGYLIKNGQFTRPAKVKIKVIPAPQKE